MAKIVEYSNSKGKLYRFRVYAGIDETTGKKKYIKRSGFKTKAQAKKELVKLEYEIANGDYFKPAEIRTFRDVYSLWLDQHRLTVKESSVYMIQSYFNKHILPAVGSYNVDNLTLATCQRAVNKWCKARPASFKNLIAYASLVVEYAIRLDLTSVNNFKRTSKPRTVTKRSDRNYLDPNELKQFLALAEKKSLKQYAMFRLLAYSGMRIGEALALTWHDVDLKNNVITVNKTQTRGLSSNLIQTPKTKASNRILNMDLETMQILKRWKVQQASYLLKVGINAMDKGQLVFSNQHNSLLTSQIVRGWCNRIIEAGNNLPKITLHGFRHTHATLLFSAGASVKEVQTRLGHSKSQTTLDIYTHLTQQDQKDTIQKLVRFLG